MKNMYKSFIIIILGYILLLGSSTIMNETTRILFALLGLILFFIGIISLGSIGEDIFGKENI